MGCSFSPSVSVGGDGADIVIGLDEAEVEVGAAAGPHLLQVLQGGGLVVGDVELAHLHVQLRGQLGQVVVAEAEVVQPRAGRPPAEGGEHGLLQLDTPHPGQAAHQLAGLDLGAQRQPLGGGGAAAAAGGEVRAVVLQRAHSRLESDPCT